MFFSSILNNKHYFSGKPGPCPDGGGIPSITYVMADEFANTMYDSCKDVQMPNVNDKAMSVMCGVPAADCNPKVWLDFMGSTGNGQAPFPIIYHFSNTTWTPGNITFYPMNVTNMRCNVTTNFTDACSCQDCEASCAAVAPPPSRPKPFTILHIDGISFIMGCILIAFICFFGTYVICISILKHDSLGDGKHINTNSVENASNGSQQNLLSRQISLSEIGILEKLGLRLENLLTAGFTTWGRLCAKYPPIVLLVTVIIFGSLAGGISRYNITTDPVKLWSSPLTAARLQKDYFDSHFGYG